MTVDDVIKNVVLPNEGGYVNDARDAGGETKFGITIATARAQGYTGPMRDMSEAFAIEVYRRQYADAPGFTAISAISMLVAAELIDTGVNMGPTVAATFLQRLLNVLNNGGKDYADLIADGQAGQKTRDALSAFLKKRHAEGEAVLVDTLKALRKARYVSLGESRIANEAFMYGWLRRAAA